MAVMLPRLLGAVVGLAVAIAAVSSFSTGSFAATISDRIYYSTSVPAGANSLNLDGSDIRLLNTVCSNFQVCGAGRSITYDADRAHIYLSTSSGNIYRSNADGSGVILLFDRGGAGPEDIEFDPIGQRILTNRGEIIDLTGSSIGTWGGDVKDLSIDPVNEHIYYMAEDIGGVFIGRKDLDGSNAVQLLDIGFGGDHLNVAFDLVTNSLFWTQRFGTGDGLFADGAGIGRANLDGTGAHMIVSDLLLPPWDSIYVDSLYGYLYLASADNTGIFRTNLDGSDFLQLTTAAPAGATDLLLAPDAPIFLPPSAAVPLPAALPLFATALAGMGLLGWRRKRKAAAAV